ncbi:MAG: S46 family peptidase [Alphaproteobacteria bacterium]|nr:S46 family peptidase [Alphaproteobacteria bacterium]MBU1527113.1 S46 family peptidase [Alphaproteobacteria bacterium]MBU2350691.1 S46 family peptidase [Alphaproteobacteria bacterium]MBU2383308.1 S46 family peptidase [Alphaproteobacteria bacterium]
MSLTRRLVAAATAFAFLIAPTVQAGEGMWTFDNFPIARVNATLGTNIDQEWLDRVRLSSVKFGGCSAGLVSAEGLVMTNNHCVASCVAQLSTPQVNYAATGFLPASRAEEKRCPGGSAEILIDIADVTDRMQAAGADQSGSAFVRARDAEAAAIEAEACAGKTDSRCQVVTLYRGGQFKLYTYKRYADVRLAWAPEDRAATFGGDLDNFNFPRFAIDAAFIRLYENGVPAATPTHFKWNASKPTEGEPIFVSGSPGATQRLLTQDQLYTVRDVILPMDQLIASELRGRMIRYGEESPDRAFEVMDPLVGLENTYKRGIGRMRALIDVDFMAKRAADEADFRARVAANPALAADVGDPWGDLAAIQPTQRALYPGYTMLEARAGGGSVLFAYAWTLVRAAQERAKPSGERLPEYVDGRLGAAQSRIAAERPIYAELEEMQVSWWLSKTREWLTVDDPRVRGLLGQESPEGLAARVIGGTKLADPAVRRALWDGGLAAIEASDDPLIQWVLSIQDESRAARAEWEERVVGPTDRASETLARARFGAYGDSVYPDATGTLRLTYGRVEGWTYQGQTVPAFTTFAGLWDRMTGAAPFDVAPKLLAARGRIPADTVLNMAVSTDTIGGSSGSPAVNAAGEIVGANFDSTILTQRNAYGYDPNVNRSVIVTTGAVTVSLRDVYGMDHLLEELGV